MIEPFTLQYIFLFTCSYLIHSTFEIININKQNYNIREKKSTKPAKMLNNVTNHAVTKLDGGMKNICINIQFCT